MEFFSQLRNKSKSYGSGNDGSSECIPEECRKLMLENNFTSSLLNRTVCEEIRDPIIPWVLCLISAVIFAILFFELILIWFKHSMLDNVFGKSLLTLGIVNTTITQLCTMPYVQLHSHGITLWYNVVLGAFSIIFMFFGSWFMFYRSEENIGSHDKGMGLVVLIIAFLLIIPEAIVIFTACKTEHVSGVFKAYLSVYAVEQLIQLLVYCGIRRCKPCEDFKKGAIYYFQLLSYLNFTMWLNCILFADIQIYDEESHSDAFAYVDDTFRALVIDYRLLFALLFLESALALNSAEEERPHRQDEEEHPIPSRKRWVYTALGVVIGLVCLALQIVKSVQMWDKSIDNAVNICPILVDAFLVFGGLWLLRSVKVSLSPDKKLDLVCYMVMSMGAITIAYLFIFSVLSFILYQHDDPNIYVLWSAIMFLVRGLSLWVLLLVYAAIPVDTMKLRENHINHIYCLVSALFLGLSSRFVGSILDEFDDTMHKIAHRHMASNELRFLQDLFVIAPLFQIATSLHLSLHFLLLVLRLHKGAVQPTDDTTQPNDDLVQPNVGFAQQQRDDPTLELSNEYSLQEDTPLLRGKGRKSKSRKSTFIGLKRIKSYT